MNPVYLVIGAAVALALAVNLFADESSAGPGAFTVQGGKRFWAPAEMSKLRAFLQIAMVQPHSQTARVWVNVLPGTSGGQSALSLVRAIHGRGNVAFSSDNLFAPGADWAISEMTPAELPKASSVGVAIIPVGV